MFVAVCCGLTEQTLNTHTIAHWARAAAVASSLLNWVWTYTHAHTYIHTYRCTAISYVSVTFWPTIAAQYAKAHFAWIEINSKQDTERRFDLASPWYYSPNLCVCVCVHLDFCIIKSLFLTMSLPLTADIVKFSFSPYHEDWSLASSALYWEPWNDCRVWLTENRAFWILFRIIKYCFPWD